MSGPGPEQRYAILVAEDEPGIRGALELLLGLEGYDVVAVSNGLQALDALARAEYDLIITDHMMPWMDGPALLGRVRADERFSDLPAIMMSAVSHAPAAADGLADAFVPKPFEILALLQVVQRLLQERGARSAEDRA